MMGLAGPSPLLVIICYLNFIAHRTTNRVDKNHFNNTQSNTWCGSWVNTWVYKVCNVTSHMVRSAGHWSMWPSCDPCTKFSSRHELEQSSTTSIIMTNVMTNTFKLIFILTTSCGPMKIHCKKISTFYCILTQSNESSAMQFRKI